MPDIRKIIGEAQIVRKRVAAYARVSADSESARNSLSAQISHYSRSILSNPEWDYAGFYADEGISGTRKVRREQFQRLLHDCDRGKIDLILTKSVSRFARNTLDLLEIFGNLFRMIDMGDGQVGKPDNRVHRCTDIVGHIR